MYYRTRNSGTMDPALVISSFVISSSYPTPCLLTIDHKDTTTTWWPITMDQPTQKRVLKACDACKRRKVKCNGQERCQQCAHLGLRCIYSPSNKHRSQGKRGHVISEFRNQTCNKVATSPLILPANARQAGPQLMPYENLSPTIERQKSDAGMRIWRHRVWRWLTECRISSIIIFKSIW